MRFGQLRVLKAAKRGESDFLLSLLQNGKSPNIVDENGKSALAYAVENGHHQCVKLLLCHEEIDLLSTVMHEKPFIHTRMLINYWYALL